MFFKKTIIKHKTNAIISDIKQTGKTIERAISFIKNHRYSRDKKTTRQLTKHQDIIYGMVIPLCVSLYIIKNNKKLDKDYLLLLKSVTDILSAPKGENLEPKGENLERTRTSEKE